MKFSLAAAVSAFAVVAQAANFEGKGQLRALWNDPVHMGEDLGCITQEGFWTVDEDKCGTFTSEKSTTATYPLQIKGELGYCQPSPFDCTKSAQTTPGFSTWVDVTVPGRGVLVSGNGGIYASDTGNNPPLPGEVSKIKFYSGTEKGKWIWLGWKAL
ncbi:hypothetical protein DL770_008397 [Monosporascus sp. CRB-9-2]|nr:hypothetical protein DL770_008397 [Monosporascus sp. CRB-9-2]